jgi:hypothetical protein
MNQEPEIVESREVAPLTAQEIKAQVQLIQEVMQAVMQEGYHFGVIPGTEKPTLLKPGAEKLTMTFRLAPMLHVESRELGNGHREYQVRCTLVHIPTGRIFGEGVGLCSTLEGRYRYRYAERLCPNCGRSTIIKGRAEYGGGWLCFQRKGGCGAKFDDQDPAIVSQQFGRIENPDIADTYNTVLKMAKKRALIDATLTATAASDIFTQDLEDFAPDTTEPAKPGAQLPLHTPASSSPPVKPPQPAKTNGNSSAPNKGQFELIQSARRRSKVSEAEFTSYLLETYNSSDLREVKQKDLNRILEWLEQQHAKHLETEERKALQEGA